MVKLKQQLVPVASAFCAVGGRSQARISTVILGAGDRLWSLRAGPDTLSGNVEKGLRWFSDHWPDEVKRREPSLSLAGALASSDADRPA